MRSPTAPNFERFLRAVHRRLVLVRLVERVGYGALAGCGAGLLLVPLLLWQGRPALVPAAFLLALGAAAGFVWGFVHRPTRLAAAGEADGQLGLSDLLATATAIRPDPTDPWLRTVLALADDRCRARLPSQVILNRLGVRAWGGIGLAAALVLTLAALTSHPVDLRAGGPRATTSARPTPAEQPQPGEPFARVTPQAVRPSGGPQENGNSAIDPPAVTSEATPQDATRPNSQTATNRSSTSTDDGRGGGAARARTPQPSQSSPSSPVAHPETRPLGSGSNEAVGRGVNTASRPSPGGIDAGGTVAAPAPRVDPAPPWRSDTWPADAAAAEEAVRSGRVPDAYGDLVRDYFDRR